MEILVHKPGVIKVRVQSTLGYCVCIKCKGAKEVYVTDYYNPSAMRSGGLVSAGHKENCPHCSGRGYWKPL